MTGFSAQNGTRDVGFCVLLLTLWVLAASPSSCVAAPSHIPMKASDILLPDDLQPVDNIDVPTFMRRQAD